MRGIAVALILASTASAQTSADRKASAIEHCDRGVAHLYKVESEIDSAIEDFNEAIRNDRSYARAFRERGTAWRRKGSIYFDLAMEDFNESIRLDPKDALAHRARSEAWLDQGEVDLAIKDLAEALRLKPGDFDIALDLRYAEALKEIGESRKMKLGFLRGRGNRWLDKDEFDAAIRDFNEVIDKDPKSAEAYYGRGRAWRGKNKLDTARQDLTEAIRIYSKYAEAFLERAQIAHAQGELEPAIADYSEAIRLNPEDPLAHNQRGWIRATAKDAKYRDGTLAIQDASRACELTEWKHGTYLDTLAAAHAEAGNFARAIEYQEKAIPLMADQYREAARQNLALYRDQKPYREK